MRNRFDEVRRIVRENDDRGMSLMELMVGMVLMSIFMAMFTGAVYLMMSDVNKVDATASSEQQVSQAYEQLDKIVRYASGITTPGQSTGSGYWYVELSVPTTNGASTCYRLRVNSATQQLQQQTWSVSATGTAGQPSAYRTMASGITNGAAVANSATTPFVLATTSASQNQQLKVNLTASQLTAGTSTTGMSVTFTALNSASDYGTSTPAVCAQQGARP